jgi:hypothetical protein
VRGFAALAFLRWPVAVEWNGEPRPMPCQVLNAVHDIITAITIPRAPAVSVPTETNVFQADPVHPEREF